MMKGAGGFEGNAQSLRIIAKLEEKETRKIPKSLDDANSDAARNYGVDRDGNDYRIGLNWTYRSLAALLKYDRKIPRKRNDEDDQIIKGYYEAEKELVDQIKKHVSGGPWDYKKRFRTIECSIMDVADDITYSTYDLEDVLQAGLFSPLGIISAIASNDDLLSIITKKINEDFVKQYGQLSMWGSVEEGFLPITDDKVIASLAATFENFLDRTAAKYYKDGKKRDPLGHQSFAVDTFMYSQVLCGNAYRRTKLTSSLVKRFISGVGVEIDREMPQLSQVYLRPDIFLAVAALKHFNYEAMIQSSRLKIAEHRGYEIVQGIFEDLADDKKKGYRLLPEQWQWRYRKFRDKFDRERVICDFIAGMTDRLAFDFYGRLKGENPRSIFRAPEV